MPEFTTADRVGVIGGYLGGLNALNNGGEAKIAGIIFKLEDVERMQEYVALEAQ